MIAKEKERRTAKLFGGLLIASIAFGIANSVPALESPNYLAVLRDIEAQVLVAVFFQAAMALSYTWIATLTYPLVKRWNPELATSYLGLRLIGAGFLFAGIASLLLLLWLSQQALTHPYAHTLGELLRRGRDILNHIGMILPWTVGSLILYSCFAQTKLIPRWLSVWGIVGSSLTLGSTLLLMLTVIDMATPVYFVMNAPLALLEVSLAVFLIRRGFSPGRVS